MTQLRCTSLLDGKKKTETNEFIKKESISEILNTSGGLFSMVAYHLVLIPISPNIVFEHSSML